MTCWANLFHCFDALQKQWDKFAQQVISLRKAQGDYLAVIRAETGKQIFDEIRKETSDLVDVENGLLKTRNDASRSAPFWVIVVYVSLVLILSGVIALSGRRQIMVMSESYGDALRQHLESTKS